MLSYPVILRHLLIQRLSDSICSHPVIVRFSIFSSNDCLVLSSYPVIFRSVFSSKDCQIFSLLIQRLSDFVSSHLKIVRFSLFSSKDCQILCPSHNIFLKRWLFFSSTYCSVLQLSLIVLWCLWWILRLFFWLFKMSLSSPLIPLSVSSILLYYSSSRNIEQYLIRMELQRSFLMTAIPCHSELSSSCYKMTAFDIHFRCSICHLPLLFLKFCMCNV